MSVNSQIESSGQLNSHASPTASATFRVWVVLPAAPRIVLDCGGDLVTEIAQAGCAVVSSAASEQEAAHLAVGPYIETATLLDRDHVVDGAVLGMLELSIDPTISARNTVSPSSSRGPG